MSIDKKIYQNFLKITKSIIWKKSKIIALSIFAILFTYFIIKNIIDIGEKTSLYGDQFGIQYLFKITETQEGDPFAIRSKPNTEKKYKFDEDTQIDQVYLLKNENILSENRSSNVRWVEVNPYYKRVKVENPSKSDKIEKHFGKGSGFISSDAGEKLSPFQYNVQKFIELKDIKDSENYVFKSILKFFTVRKHVTVIYYFMALLLIAFLFQFLYRLYFLWYSYNHQEIVSASILENNSVTKRQLNQLASEDHIDIPHSFIARIHSSFKLNGDRSNFENIYKEFIDSEEDNAYQALINLKNSNLWIIRAGIFGTLVGLVVAFFELYIGMGLVTPDDVISENFINQIQAALLGNALAIATSITAHGATLLVEVFLISLISRESNKEWIESAYQSICSLKFYRNPVKNESEAIVLINELTDSIASDFEQVSVNLKGFSKSAIDSQSLINNMNTSIINVNKGLADISKNLKEANIFTNSFKEASGQIYERTKSTKLLVDEASNNIEDIRNQSLKLSKYLGRKMDQIQNAASETINRAQTFIAGIGERLKSLKDKV